MSHHSGMDSLNHRWNLNLVVNQLQNNALGLLFVGHFLQKRIGAYERTKLKPSHRLKESYQRVISQNFFVLFIRFFAFFSDSPLIPCTLASLHGMYLLHEISVKGLLCRKAHAASAVVVVFPVSSVC